ncbi:MAG: hypothetical protein V4580_17365 [Bacteroidota bacterium]
MKILNALIALFGNLESITGCSFVSIVYTNAENEVQKTLINVGVSYDNAKLKDIEFLKNLDVKTIKSTQGVGLLEEARKALLGALISPSKAMSEGQKNAYTYLTNGLKIHNETNELYVVGMVVKKEVLVSGDYKADTRKPLTIAKDDIRKEMKSTQYRNYNLSQLATVNMKGDTLVFA